VGGLVRRSLAVGRTKAVSSESARSTEREEGIKRRASFWLQREGQKGLINVTGQTKRNVLEAASPRERGGEDSPKSPRRSKKKTRARNQTLLQ